MDEQEIRRRLTPYVNPYVPPTVYYKFQAKVTLRPFTYDADMNEFSYGEQTKTSLTLLQGYNFADPSDRARGLETVNHAYECGWPRDDHCEFPRFPLLLDG